MTTTPQLRPPRTTGPAGSRLALTLQTAFAPAVWGSTYLVTTELLPAGHPMFAGLMRALPAGLLALAITRSLPAGRWWWRAGLLGVLNIGAFFPLLFLAAERLPGGVAATVGAAQPLIVAGLVVAVLRETPSTWRLVWAVVGLLGIAMVVLGPDARFDLVGIAAGLGGAASMALGVTLAKRWGRPDGVGAMAFTGWQLMAGGLFLLPLTLLVEGVPERIDGPAALGYLWLGLIGGLVAYTLWFRGIGKLPVTATAFLVPLSPLVAAVLGAAVLGETFTLVQLGGFALALAALVAGQVDPVRRAGGLR